MNKKLLLLFTLFSIQLHACDGTQQITTKRKNHCISQYPYLLPSILEFLGSDNEIFDAVKNNDPMELKKASDNHSAIKIALFPDSNSRFLSVPNLIARSSNLFHINRNNHARVFENKDHQTTSKAHAQNILNYLCENIKGNINEQNEHGNTLMHIATAQCDIYEITLLKQAGAKMNIKNNDGNTPIQVAVSRKDKNDAYTYIKLIETLVVFGADINAKNHKNKSAYELFKATEKPSSWDEIRNFNQISEMFKNLGAQDAQDK